jgi:hypothetical protein
MKDKDKKSINSNNKPIITPGQVLDISKRSKTYPTPPCALDSTTKSGKLAEITMQNNSYNYGDPSLKLIRDAYLDILEGHTREELEKLSKEDLEKLKKEYRQKEENAESEKEAEDHREEQQIILDILKNK